VEILMSIQYVGRNDGNSTRFAGSLIGGSRI
jgi:hypothetical protein